MYTTLEPLVYFSACIDEYPVASLTFRDAIKLQDEILWLMMDCQNKMIIKTI